jgi:2,6-dihydroxypseudooxynicotine hydrolase
MTASPEEAREAAMSLSLEGRTGAIRCPLLVVIGRKDRIIPAGDGERLVEEVQGAELIALAEGNHGCANVAPMHRHATADWMAAHLR